TDKRHPRTRIWPTAWSWATPGLVADGGQSRRAPLKPALPRAGQLKPNSPKARGEPAANTSLTRAKLGANTGQRRDKIGASSGISRGAFAANAFRSARARNLQRSAGINNGGDSVRLARAAVPACSVGARAGLRALQQSK